jgi:sodium-coupled neutral amino acid transporter 11
MVAYLLIIKDVLPVLFHVAPHDVGINRIIMFVSSLLIIVPLSMQRDMADLEKTSRLNVFLDVCLVALVTVFSPVVDNAEGGILQTILDEPLLDLKNFFVGFGVCSFAFVCQDSSFIIAGEFAVHSAPKTYSVNGSLTSSQTP